MEQIINYVKPELLGLSAALYFVGMALKNTRGVKDKYIPIILGGISIILCSIWTAAVCPSSSWQDIAKSVFTAITQGILAAGLSTYVNQIIKQLGKTV